MQQTFRHWARSCVRTAGRTAFVVAIGVMIACNLGIPGTAAAPAGVDGRIGIELDDLDSSSQAAFVDAIQQAAPWSAPGGLRLDAAGNVRELGPGQVAQTVVCAGGAYPAGDYTLLFDGRGTLALDTGTVIARSARRIVVRISPGAAGARLTLSATDPSDPIRNVHLIAPGYESSYANAPFFPGFITAVAHFHSVRFANWMHAGTLTPALDWLARSTTSQATQVVDRGVAPEYLIALANATGDDPWFVFPAGVTDAYVTHFAQLVRATLDPRLHATFEYATAMWVAGSPTGRYATLAGRTARFAAAPQSAAAAWYVLRSGQIFSRLAAVFGPAGAGYHRVIAGPLGLPGSPEAAFTAQLLAAPQTRLADVFAVAEIANAGLTAPGLVNAHILRTTGAAANHAGLALWAYAADISAPTSIGASAAERPLYNALFDGWHAAGGGLAVTSSFGFSGKWAAIADLLQRYPMAHVPGSAGPPRGAVASQAMVVAPQAALRAGSAQQLSPGSDVIAIDCGGSAAGTWVADTDFSSPSSTYGETSKTVATGAVMSAAPQAVYQTQRSSSGTPFRYIVPGLVAGSAYTVRLHFAELLHAGVGDRIFNVDINGAPVLTNFDVLATAGGADIAVVENFYATANAAGQIVITFSGVVDNPVVNGIEIAMPGPIDVLAINAGGSSSGRWLADIDSNGGTAYAESSTPIVTTGLINPAPQAVYASERVSNSTLIYSIPGLTPGAPYRVRLHFAELTATQKGQRLFNVTINGTRVLTKFDIFATAHGAFRAVIEGYTVYGSGSGSIVITLTPAPSDPQINGIEIEALPTVDAAAVNAGGGAAGIWAANTDATGLTETATGPIGISGISSPAPQAVYQTQRYMNAGPLIYQIPGLIPNAAYTVRLHFADFDVSQPGVRQFNVAINATQVLTNFDIVGASGGQNRAVVKNFRATANAAGQIVVALTNVLGKPAINGIEIVNPNEPAVPPSPTPTPVALCIGGSSYTPTQDDEFSNDTAVNYAPDLIEATPQPNGAVWSSRAWDFSSDYSRNNIGTDDAYYTDPTRGLGPFSPFSLANGALTITAVPVPTPYATASPLLGAHWLSGLLESRLQTYGYIEVSAAVPNLQGQFSAPLWLLGPYGSDGNGNGYEELDVNEMFGAEAPINVLFQTQNYTAAAAGSQPVINHVPVEVELNAGTTFHTYGVLWTPSIVRFYVDREPTGPDWANGMFGPMHAIIKLGVFTQNTWSPGPPNGSPETMSVQYFRWYQSGGTSCSPAQMPS